MRRLRAAGAAIGLALLWATTAHAEYRGTDLMDNIGPGSAFDGAADRYPLSAYALDYHVDVGVTHPDGIPAMITQWAAAQIWYVLAFAFRLIIDVFAWAFSLDLLGGANGALAPVAASVRNSYQSLGGEQWLVVAVVIAGTWALWRGLVQRRYTDTVGGLFTSMVILILALACVYQPQQSIGQASRLANDLSGAFLAAGSGRSPGDQTEAKRDVVAYLRETLIYKPWVVLDFGGLEHCVDTHDTDSDGFPRPVGKTTPTGGHNPKADVCRDHIKRGADGHGGYAPRFLRYAVGSKERNAEYEALKNGEAPRDPQFAGYPVDKADAPAVDVQQEGGAFQRLTLVILIALGALGIIALLALLSLIVILAQVAALVLFGFAPVALVVGVIPGRGHDLFKWWGTTLLTALFIKVLYSLVIGILVLISNTLTGATASMGFLFAFGLQSAFFWMVLIYRKRITQRLLGATFGRSERHEHRYLARRAEYAAERPFSALAGRAIATTAAAATAAVGAYKQQPVGSPDSAPKDDPKPKDGADGADGRTGASAASTNGSRGLPESEPHQLDGHGPPLRTDTLNGDGAQRKQQPEPAGQVEQQPSGLVTGALDPPRPVLTRKDAQADLHDLDAEPDDPPEPRRIESVIRDQRMAQLGELMADHLEPPASREPPAPRRPPERTP